MLNSREQIELLLRHFGIKKIKELSDIIDVPANYISGWRSRGIPAEERIRISKIVGKPVTWFETGEEQTSQTKSNETAAIDLRLVSTVVETVMEHLQKEKKDLDPATIGDLVVTLYEEFSETKEKKVNKRTVARMIRLAKS